VSTNSADLSWWQIITILVMCVLILFAMESCNNADEQRCRERGGTPVVDYRRQVVCVK
jgi:hypothetical protein